jgi:hypothetical protein
MQTCIKEFLILGSPFCITQLITAGVPLAQGLKTASTAMPHWSEGGD